MAGKSTTSKLKPPGKVGARAEKREPDEWSGTIDRLRGNTNRAGTFAEQLVERARGGDPEAARDILRDYVDAMGQLSQRAWNEGARAPNFYVYARYIADAFEEILRQRPREEDAAKVLGLRGKQAGAPQGWGWDNEAIAAIYFLLLRYGFIKVRALDAMRKHLILAPNHRKKRGGRVGISARGIQDAAKKYRYLEAREANFLKATAKPYVRQFALMLDEPKGRK